MEQFEHFKFNTQSVAGIQISSRKQCVLCGKGHYNDIVSLGDLSVIMPQI